jgi:glycosyltransferase involved in cell wall biosynthesis
MFLSVVLPIYNECNRLEATVRRLKAYLDEAYGEYEIIIIEDNSTDGSYEIAKGIEALDHSVVLIHNDVRQGRGTSLAAALEKARGDYVIYMDADLSTDLRHTGTLVDGLIGGASVTTGSRLMSGSRAKRPLSRHIASMAYNSLARLLFGSAVHDHQCGFKGFRKNDVLGMIGLIRENHWLWDTELLVICQRLGLMVHEFPVTWTHNGGSILNTSKVKVLRDSFHMGIKLLGLRYRLALYDIVKINTEGSPNTQ